MNIQTVRGLLGSFFVAASALLLSSCGGGSGGAAGNPNLGGPLTLQPQSATFYAGIPVTMTVSGGRAPYSLTSSEPTILGVPSIINGNTFTVIPNQPGVIDVGLEPGALPIRTVTVSARDSTGVAVVFSTVQVAQNFLTGYGFSFQSNCETSGGTTAAPPAACGGGITVGRVAAVFGGALYGNRTLRIEAKSGPFTVRNPVTNQGGNSTTITTDHEGKAFVYIEVASGTFNGPAVIRIVDPATGVYSDTVFFITGTATQTSLVAVPNSFTFTGPLSTICGTGTADFFVFGGRPPYTAVSSDPNVTVTPSSTGSSPGRFTISANNPNVCVSNATVVVTDSTLGRTTVTVTTEVGSTTPPPPPPLTVAPSSISLACGTSGSVAVVGGNGSYFVTSSHPGVTAAVSGGVITITRLAGNAAVLPTTASIGVTDGASAVTIQVTVPAQCP